MLAARDSAPSSPDSMSRRIKTGRDCGETWHSRRGPEIRPLIPAGEACQDRVALSQAMCCYEPLVHLRLYPLKRWTRRMVMGMVRQESGYEDVCVAKNFHRSLMPRIKSSIRSSRDSVTRSWPLSRGAAPVKTSTPFTRFSSPTA